MGERFATEKALYGGCIASWFCYTILVHCFLLCFVLSVFELYVVVTFWESLLHEIINSWIWTNTQIFFRAGEWVSCSVGANFTPHIITVNAGEV